MKKIMLIMALGLNVAAYAQYNSAMDNSVLYDNRGGDLDHTVIRLNTGSNNQENPDVTNNDILNVNSIDAWQGYRNLPDNTQVNNQYIMPKDNVQRNIMVNTTMHNLGPKEGSKLLTQNNVKMNSVGQFQGNRTSTLQKNNKMSLKSNGTSANVKMMSEAQFQGNRPSSIQTLYEVGTPVNNNTYQYPQYDTSKNNGHCLGCGSGSLTDRHIWNYE